MQYLYVQLKSKCGSGKHLTLIIRNFLIELTYLSQMISFSRNLNHHWKRSKEKETFQAILVINLLYVFSKHWKIDFAEGNWSQVQAFPCMLRLSEIFPVTLYTSNDDSNLK